MNEEQKKRLLDVARACREAPQPKNFSMGSFMHSCNTPACAAGHYACRVDLHGGAVTQGDRGNLFEPRINGKEWTADNAACGYFGIDPVEADMLFGAEGCGGWNEEEGYCMAVTNLEAAEYIEAFVARKEAEQAP